MFEHIIPVFSSKVRRVQLDAQLVTDRLGVSQIIHGGAIFCAVVFVPVLHEQAFNLIALLQQQRRRYRGVDPAGHTDDDASLIRCFGGIGVHVNESNPVSSAVCSGSRGCNRAPDGYAVYGVPD